MKKFRMIAVALATTVAFASPVFAEWTKVSEGVSSGNTWFIDYDTVKENDGYVYYWVLVDYLKPDQFGDLSVKVLNELDCDIPRKFRNLSWIFYKQPMGIGSGDTETASSDEWIYPSPNSVNETVTNAACDYAGK